MTVPTAQLPAAVWELDAAHSRVGFAVPYIAGTFRADFTDFTATLDTTGPVMRLEGTAEAQSVAIRLPPFREHVVGPEFLDAQRHPRLTFVAQEIRESCRAVELQAALSVRGNTETVAGRGTLIGPVTNQFGVSVLGLRLRGTVDREAFGLTWNVELPGGRPGLDRIVELDADLQFTLPNDET